MTEVAAARRADWRKTVRNIVYIGERGREMKDSKKKDGKEEERKRGKKRKREIRLEEVKIEEKKLL